MSILKPSDLYDLYDLYSLSFHRACLHVICLIQLSGVFDELSSLLLSVLSSAGLDKGNLFPGLYSRSGMHISR